MVTATTTRTASWLPVRMAATRVSARVVMLAPAMYGRALDRAGSPWPPAAPSASGTRLPTGSAASRRSPPPCRPPSAGLEAHHLGPELDLLGRRRGRRAGVGQAPGGGGQRRHAADQ